MAVKKKAVAKKSTAKAAPDDLAQLRRDIAVLAAAVLRGLNGERAGQVQAIIDRRVKGHG